MPDDPNNVDSYEARRSEFTKLLTDNLPSALEAAQMFNDVQERTNCLRIIGFNNPDRFVRPNETPAVFIERLIQELGSKLLVDNTILLIDRLFEFNVRPNSFPELKIIRKKCDEILREMEGRVSGKLDADTGAPAEYMVKFEYGIRPYESWGKQELSDREDLWQELMDWADRNRFEGEPVFCIEAVGGLGKSMLAWSWFQEYYGSHKTDGNYHTYVWWSFYGHDAGFENFVNWALKGLGAGDIGETQEPLLDRIRRLNDILEAGGVVMVLDGVERLAVAYLDPQEREALTSIGMSGRQSSYRATREYTDNDLADEDIEEFFTSLRGAIRSRILTTSRVVPGPFVKRSKREERGVLLRRMEPLDLGFCVHLWQQINREEVHWDRVRKLCEGVGRNSLLIRILASAVAVTAGGLLDNWPKDDASRDLLTAAPVEQARSRLLRYALDCISRPARLALMTLCAFPSPMKRELALKLVSDGEVLSQNEDPEAVFDELARWALIGVVKNDGVVNAYDIHPIVRDHVRLSEVYRDPQDLAVLDNIYQAVPNPGTHQVRDVQDLNWAIAQFQSALSHGLDLNAWQVFRDRLATHLQFLGADEYIAGLLRSLFPEQSFSALPLVIGDRSAQAEILRLVATSTVRLNFDVDTDRLWRWCLALQFLTQDASSWIKALDSRISLSVYSGRLAECQDDIVRALSLAEEYNLPERNYSLYCFLGLSLAFQGDKARSMKAFEKAEEWLSAVDESSRTSSRRWVLQGRAEALVWLDDAEAAREAVKQMEDEGSSQEVQCGQRAWEEWTAAAADLMAGGDLGSALRHLNKADSIAKKQHYFLVMLLSLASRVRWAIQNGHLEQAKKHIREVNDYDPHMQCLPAQVLVNLYGAEAAKQENQPAEVNMFALKAYDLAEMFRVYRAGVERARDLLPPNLKNQHRRVPAEPRSAVLALLDRDELPTVAAEHTAPWWASHAGISARSRTLADQSLDKVAQEGSEIRAKLQFDASDAVRTWWALVEATYDARDQLLILEFIKSSDLPIEQIALQPPAEPRRLTPVIGYCGQLRTLGVLAECEKHGSQVFKELSIEDRRQWLESITSDPPYAGLSAYRLKPGVAFDRAQFDRALDILTQEDYPAFIEDLRKKCCPDTNPEADAWWTVLASHLADREILYFGEELVSLQITVAGFLEGLEIDNPQSCRARLAALYVEQLTRLQRTNFTNTAGWSEERIRARLEKVKSQINWDNTTGSARKWWEAFENENELNPVLRVAEEIAVRKATIKEFFLAYVYSNTDNIQANLHYLDYTRLKKEEEKKKKEAAARALQNSKSGMTAQSPAPVARDLWSGWTPDPLGSGFTNTTGWTKGQIRDRLEEFKTQLDWDNTTGSARKWWEAFENENELNLVLRVAEEIAVRKATIKEFFLAYVDSNTDNIQANLHYLDYTRLKKEEEKKKKEEQRAK